MIKKKGNKDMGKFEKLKSNATILTEHYKRPIRLSGRSLLERMGIKKGSPNQDLIERRIILDFEQNIPLPSHPEFISSLPRDVEKRIQSPLIGVWKKSNAILETIEAGITSDERRALAEATLPSRTASWVNLTQRGGVDVRVKEEYGFHSLELAYKGENLSISRRDETGKILLDTRNEGSDQYMSYEILPDSATPTSLSFAVDGGVRGRGRSRLINAGRAVDALQDMEILLENFAARADIPLPAEE